MASTMLINKFAHLQIPLEDVIEATNHFHDDNIIGRGGFGLVYKGELKRSGNLIKIAALRLDRKQGEGDVEFWTQISMLSDLKHTNIVSIIGFCNEKDEKIIITTYAAKGSLKEHLNSPNLTWMQRLKICVGVARALSYLHHDEERGYAIIHRNINSSTILLDENHEAKLSGFKVYLKQPVNRMDRVILSEPVGTIGYMDPEIEKSKGVTHKSDIYSFGVVLFEVLCGRKAFTPNNENRLLAPLAIHHYDKKTLKDIIYPNLRNQVSSRSLEKYSYLAYFCLKEQRAQRPDTYNIVKELEEALEFQLEREKVVNKLEHLMIPLTHIQSATNDFSETYKIDSGIPCSLYRAKVDNSDKKNHSSKRHDTVLIKRYPSGHHLYYGEKQFLKEIEVLSSVKHPNIVSLLGFCVEASEMILVNENFSNGFLGEYLGNFRDKSILTWEKRLKICIDVAHALRYIHYEMDLVNREVHSFNIGLDDNWGAKIAHFWWSVFLPPNQQDRAFYHNNNFIRDCCVEPEYEKTRNLNRESDVFGFGVVLLETLCGRLVSDQIYLKESDKGLPNIARQRFHMGTLEDMIDPVIKEETGENHFVLNKGPNKESLHTFIKIALKCVAETQDKRPTMKVVVKELEKALFFQKNNKDNPKMSFEDIKRATQNFHNDNCIGGGGFGKVYKGNLEDGDGFKIIVAKRLDTRFGQGEQQFLGELQILLDYKHENVIGLVGYCDEKDEKVIVYEYAPKGSLERYLNDASLTWVKRLNICIDVARALDFLHGGVGKQAKVIHRDIKTANILLSDDWKAKLADFGLSLISPLIQETDYVIDHACGTLGYLDPLYKKSGFLTIESDIYSFGVVLFEILCGRSTFEIHKNEGHYLPEFIKNIFEAGKHDEVVFKHIREEIVPKSLTTFQEIACQCLHHEREKRPTTKEILRELKKALEFQDVAEWLKQLSRSR
ncbi:uncharacterized protein LOC110890954 isoform X2 [Helianthus annuus]|uniref:uncharacterized protein LOC110890954 isoform X2 n=1 Tax=Helianthus annuus TaxID=4232 RepID=UPI000B8F1ACF|nr:uncharacterized protein LOC110890954 isoform X2 [Helianthus annuus]